LNLLRNDVGEKISWSGVLISIQPRIRLNRSFDQVSHAYLGYSLKIQGNIGGDAREFLLGIGAGAQSKHHLQAGDAVSGDALPVADPRLETVELYKVSNLKVTERAKGTQMRPPPWLGVPQSLLVYRERGHRRLAARRYETKCTTCVWGCHMAVEMIVDQWNPAVRRYRTETFCYGPKSCALYEPGPLRKVPGRKGMSYTEEDWIDEQATSHRSPDE